MVNEVMSKSINSKFLCNVEESCFIVIDIQEKLTQAMPGKVVERLRCNTSILLTAAKQLGIPVMASAQYPKGLGQVEESIKNELTDSSIYIEKTCFSCLQADGFKEQLAGLNVSQVILVGIEAHICVLQTAFDLFNEGYNVFVVADAIASRKLTSYESAIMRMNQAGIKIINTESVLFEWLEDASHPEFKSLSRLIV
ncbi:MAG: isochorismatase family protein [Proteobacteria bacterium]|nr:isochorismatase family protein [Pseudomonadota bacterium]